MESAKRFGSADAGRTGTASTEQAHNVDAADGPGLADLIACEDDAEANGHLDPDGRLTCHTCRTWATHAHVTSEGHWQAIRRAGAALVTPVQVVAARPAAWDKADATPGKREISVIVSPDFDAYAAGRIDASQVRCVLCEHAPCKCPPFGSDEYMALIKRRHGR